MWVDGVNGNCTDIQQIRMDMPKRHLHPPKRNTTFLTFRQLSRHKQTLSFPSGMLWVEVSVGVSSLGKHLETSCKLTQLLFFFLVKEANPEAIKAGCESLDLADRCTEAESQEVCGVLVPQSNI